MYPILKRFIDSIAALVGLLLLSPVLIVTAIVLKCTGEGKIFFTQQRVGYKNREFKIWKFITMVSNARFAPDGTVTGKNDMRITPVGRFLRNSKIDELPQLFNILKGDMSFVGPRPLMKEPDFNSYSTEVQRGIYNVRPGVTAIGSVVFRDEAALISQVRAEGEDPVKFKREVIFPYKGKVEMWYNKNQSFWVDLKILFLTAWTLFFSTSQLAFKSFDGLPQRSDLLSIEFDRMQELRESITLLLTVIFVLVPIVPSPFWFWNNPQFLLMALIPVLWFTYLLIRKDEIPLKVVPADMGWAVFIGLGFLSYCWAINGSLAWYPAFGWLCLTLWMLLFRSLSIRPTPKSILPTLFSFFFLVMLFHHFVALFFEVPTDTNWNVFFGKNANYTSCFLVSLYPYILFYDSKRRFLNLVKIFATVGLLIILLITKAKWAFWAFVIIIIYFLWIHARRRIFWSAMTSMLGLGLAVYFIGIEYFMTLPVVGAFFEPDLIFKNHLIYASIQSFIEQPILGNGLGNWQLDVYKHNLDGVERLADPAHYNRYRNHNLYGRHLVELGLLGFIAFAFPVLMAIRKGWIYYRDLSFFQQAAYASFSVYLFTSFFYADINFYEYHFSGVQLLAFCALGILTNNDQRIKRLPRYVNSLLLIFSLSCLVWFAYSKYTYDSYWEALRNKERQENELAIQQFEDLYNPIFQTANGYLDHFSFNRLIAFELAQLYERENQNEKALHNYQLAIQQAPHNELVLHDYIRFLIKTEGVTTKVKEYAYHLHSIQKNNYSTNLLLAEIAIIEQQYDAAKSYLKIAKSTTIKEQQLQIKRLEKLLPNE